MTFLNEHNLEDIKNSTRHLEQIQKDMSAIRETLAVNTAILETHIKRTDLNEARIYQLEKWLLSSMGALVLSIIGAVITYVLK